MARKRVTTKDVKKKRVPPETGQLLYNGLRLEAVRLIPSYHQGNTNWEAHLKPALSAALNLDQVEKRLAAVGLIVDGLPELPERVYSQCGTRRSAGGLLIWGFWSEPLTPWELDMHEIRQVAEGG